MSEYQQLKARALEIQRAKEKTLARELADKAERDRQAAKDEAERRKRQEAASKEARRVELMRANAALVGQPQNDVIAKRVEYDPFAEDEFPVRSKATTPLRPKAKTNTTVSRAASSSKATPNGSISKPRTKDDSGKPRVSRASPPPLGRKEKAALAFVRQTKASSADSMFSVRDLVESRPDRPRSALSRPAPPSHLSRPLIPPSRVPMTATKTGGARKGKNIVDAKDLRKLCPDRDSRDRRTIDEIQRDIKARKGTALAGSEKTPSIVRNGIAGLPRNGILGKSSDALSSPSAKRQNESPRRRPRSPSTSSDSSDSDPPAKRRARSPIIREDASRADVSALIQSMFARPGRAPPRATYDDDSGSDMEAGLSDVEEEEKRALRIARKEDEAAEREEARRREAKERLKRERLKGKV